jgi:Zn-dependent protease with chaperone function
MFMSQVLHYPASPVNADDSAIRPSAAFKKEVFNVTAAIFFFIIIYLLLVVAAGLLAALCAFGGIMLVMFLPKFITLMLGLGLCGLGVMVIYFLIKFIFKTNKVDRSGLIEVTEADQPDLFAFVRQLTEDTQAPFPKRIYLSPDVNACVFYDSGFWSMFLPVRKNLQIGLGLVNSVNVSEFKAVLAHEFGHFSQRSMKLGSYVYNVNRVIYNLLYDNDGYARALEGWANISDYFAIFASLTSAIVRGIQAILRRVYEFINKRYMSLSRQMEFHADAVAAYVSGSDHLITSLRRIEVADSCYNRLMGFYNTVIKDNLKADNLYTQHVVVMHRFSAEHNIPVLHGLPQVNADTFAHFNQQRLMIKDQWASHPSTDDREEHLNRINIKTPFVHDPAWVVFRNVENLQREMTTMIYATVAFKEKPVVLDLGMFVDRYEIMSEQYSLNKFYQGFYNGRDISTFDVHAVLSKYNVDDVKTVDQLLTPEVIALPLKVASILSDLEGLEMILKSEGKVKTFDFDGQRYTWDDVGSIVDKIRNELKENQGALQRADERIFAFAHSRAQRNGSEEQFLKDYEKLFAMTAERLTDLNLYNEISTIMSPIFESQVSIEAAHAIVNQVRLRESNLKARLQQLKSDGLLDALSVEQHAALERYQVLNVAHFDGIGFNQPSLQLLFEALEILRSNAVERTFSFKKELLQAQVSLLS